MNCENSESIVNTRTEPLRRIDSILSRIEYCCQYHAENEHSEPSCKETLWRSADGIHEARTLLAKHIESEELLNASMTQHVQWLYEQMKEKRQLEDAQRPYTPVLDKETGRMWLCGYCGEYVGFEDNDPHDPNEFDKHCRECGHPVKWENRWEEHQRRMNSDNNDKENANE